MATDKDLPRILAGISAAIPIGTLEGVRKVARAVGIRVVIFTPVDTGKARSNWIGTVGNPTGATITAYAPGKHLGRGESANRQGAINQISAAIRSLRPGQEFWIANNVDYIEDLNNSPQKSRQTAPGFVQRAVIDGSDAANVGEAIVKRLCKVIGRL